MKTMIAAVSAIALSVALAGSAQAGCDSGCSTSIPANVANIYNQGNEAVVSIRQSGYQNNFAHSGIEAPTGKTNISQLSTTGSNTATMVNDNENGTALILQNAAKSNSLLATQSGDSLKGTVGSVTTVAAQKAGNGNFAFVNHLQAKEGTTIVTQEPLYSGTNTIDSYTTTASSISELGQRGNGLNAAKSTGYNATRSVVSVEQTDLSKGYLAPDLTDVSKMVSDLNK